MIKYLKITTEKYPCRSCNGQGWKWETVYHNQTKKCKCYDCTDGMIEVDKHEDVTQQLSKSHNATMDTLIDFAVYLTGHDHLTVLQMFNDYSKTAHKS